MMRCSFNILRVLITLSYVNRIYGLRAYGVTDYLNTATSVLANHRPIKGVNVIQAEHNIERSGLVKSNNPLANASFNENSNIEQDVKKNFNNEKTVKHLIKHNENDEKKTLNRLINKYISKSNTNSAKNNKNYKEVMNKFANKQSKLFNDLLNDNVDIREHKVVQDSSRNSKPNNNNADDGSNVMLFNKLLKFPNSEKITSNEHVIDKLYSDVDEDVMLQRNGIKQRIKNRQPMYNGKLDELESVNELEYKLNNPIQENYLIDNVLNTQNFITYLKKSLTNNSSTYKNSFDSPFNIKNSNDEINRYVYKRHASLLPGSDKNYYKKKRKFNKASVDSSVVKKQGSTTKKPCDDYDDYIADSTALTSKPKKSKCNDQCTTTCEPETTTCKQTTLPECPTTCETTVTCEPTTCEATTTCPPETTTCEVTTECKVTTPCEETTPCDFFEPTVKCTKKRKPCKTTCRTTQSTCETTCEEETECEEETTECTTTPKCKTTEQCDESEFASGEENGDEAVQKIS